MKVLIKHINDDNVSEVEQFVKEKGLKAFHSSGMQYRKVPEGEHEIDTEYMFSNQYNTVGKEGEKGQRIFEYCRVWNSNHTKLLNTGYYIAEGIEEIREYQKRVKKCHFCGKQYLNSGLEFCIACRGSAYLKEEYFHLLRLTYITEEHSEEPLPEYIIADIMERQRETATRIVEERLVSDMKELKKDLERILERYEKRKKAIEEGKLVHEVRDIW